MKVKVFPAYAGVILVSATVSNPSFSIPRVCGGDPRFCQYVYLYAQYSPRMRG